MPTKTKTATKTKAATKKTGDIIFTDNTIVITLDAETSRKAKNCLEKNKKITFSITEHKLTRLPGIRNAFMFTD